MTNFTTPVGRLIAGSLTNGDAKDREGNPLVWKSGPNAGQPRVAFWFQLAISKTNPEWPALHALIDAKAKSEFASLNIFNPQTGACTFRDFAWKVEDGDSTEIKTAGGKSYSQREGCPGHWILRFSGSFAPKCVGASVPISEIDPKNIKLGDYIRVAGSVKGNGDNKEPGLFLNYDFVQLVGYGPAIEFGPDAGAAFAAPIGYMPPEMSTTPVAPVGPIATLAPPPAMMAPPPPAPAFVAPPAPQILAGPALYDVGGQKYTEAQLLAAGYPPAVIATLPRV